MRFFRSKIDCYRLFFLFMPLFFFGCGNAPAVNSSSNPPENEDPGSIANPVSGRNISVLNLSGENGEVRFANLSDDSNVVLAIHSHNNTNTTETFTLGSTSATTYLMSEKENEEPDTQADEDATEEFHMRLRDLEENLDGDLAMPVNFSQMALLEVGSQRPFRVLNSILGSNTYDTVTATLRYQNEYFEFYVDTRDEAALSDSDLATLAEAYTEAIPYERMIFGQESDVNGDGKFAVLFTHTVNGLTLSSGGIVTGFFYAADLLSRASYDLSNEMEVFYSLVPDPTGNYGAVVSESFAMTNILPGVLVHEYQHMINFNQHYFINNSSAELSFLNEGLSHLAEDIYSLLENSPSINNLYMPKSGIGNPPRVASYLNNISHICFTCGSNLNQRGGSYLFLRYLYEQAELGHIDNAANGTDLIHNLLDTSYRGVENIVAATYGDSPPTDAFESLLGKFSLAVYLSNQGLSDDDRWEFSGINLRSVPYDNQGSLLNGPAIQKIQTLPFTDTLQGNSLTYVQISGSLINDNGGVLPLAVSTDAELGGYMIQN